MDELQQNRNVLIVDDNESIHLDFKRVLTPSGHHTQELDALAMEFFGEEEERPLEQIEYKLQFASQGNQALAIVEENLERGVRFAVAFVDVRMPPGWDGIETIGHLWKVDPNIQVVLCTAYSDYNWEDIQKKLGQGHQFVILKKPFDTMEAQQLACALTEKWNAERRADMQMDELEAIVEERTKKLREANQGLRRQIAERAKAEMALKETAKRFQATFEQAAVGIAHIAPEGRFLRLNSRICNLVGYSLAELQSKRLEDITCSDDMSLDAPEQEMMLSHEIETYSVEKRLVCKNGAFVWVTLTVSLLWTPQGRPHYFIYVVQDITDRKEAQDCVLAGNQQIQRQRQALSATEKKFATVFLVSPLAMAITTIADGRFLDVNDACLDLIGLEHRQVAGKRAGELGFFHDPEQWSRIVDQIETVGCVREMIVPLKGRDGVVKERVLAADKILIGEGEFLLVVFNVGLK